MEQGTNNLPIAGQEEEVVVGDGEESEDSEEEFDCQPVKKRARTLDYSMSAEQSVVQVVPVAIKSIGILLNTRSKRAAMHLAIQGLSTGYVDQDNSGTYDPKLDRATPPRTPIARRERDPSAGPNQTKTKKVGYSFPVILTLKSAKSLDYLRSISPALGLYSSSSSELADDRSDYESRDPGLRRRRRAKKPVAGAIARHNGLTIDQLPKDHPQRRGCKACFELGDDECGLIQDKYDWPCGACLESNIECELIVPPKFKKGCTRCKQKRLKCPFREDGGKGVDSCSFCEEVGETCIAGPLDECLEYKFDGGPAIVKTALEARAIDKTSSPPQPQESPKIPVPRPRQYVMCNQCRASSLRCTLKRDQEGPCKHCRLAGDQCKFVYKSLGLNRQLSDILLSMPNGQIQVPLPEDDNDRHQAAPTSPSANTRQLYSEILSKRKYSTVPRKYNKQSKANNCSKVTKPTSKLIGITEGIQHIVITTSFCHPIKFFYLPDPQMRHPCSWCTSPVFGLWGHSSRQVEVIPFGKDVGNEEMSGGHSEDGVEQTRMCCQCTLERTNIIYCEGDHNTQQIEGLDPKTLDLDAIGRSLVALAEGDQDGAQLVKVVKWCNICVAPAEYACQCGLHLCPTCNDLLLKLKKRWTKTNKNILDDLVKLWKDELWKRQNMGELRADAEFLLTTGELSMRMEYMGMSTAEEDEVGVSIRGGGFGSQITTPKSRASSKGPLSPGMRYTAFTYIKGRDAGTTMLSPPGTDDDKIKGTPLLDSEQFHSMEGLQATITAKVKSTQSRLPDLHSQARALAGVPPSLFSSATRIFRKEGSPSLVSSSPISLNSSTIPHIQRLVNRSPPPEPSTRKALTSPPPSSPQSNHRLHQSTLLGSSSFSNNHPIPSKPLLHSPPRRNLKQNHELSIPEQNFATSSPQANQPNHNFPSIPVIPNSRSTLTSKPAHGFLPTSNTAKNNKYNMTKPQIKTERDPEHNTRAPSSTSTIEIINLLSESESGSGSEETDENKNDWQNESDEDNEDSERESQSDEDSKGDEDSEIAEGIEVIDLVSDDE